MPSYAPDSAIDYDSDWFMTVIGGSNTKSEGSVKRAKHLYSTKLSKTKTLTMEYVLTGICAV